jgi:hypothetical protein
MRNTPPLTPFHRVAILAIAATFLMHAAPSEQMLWSQLALKLQGNQVTVTTKDGKSLSGRRVSVRPDGIYFADGAPAGVLRDQVLSLHWELQYETQTDKLGQRLSHAYRHSVDLLGTPMGHVVLVELPAITAWGAAVAPFCLLGDLFTERPKTSGDISILPGPALPDSPRCVDLIGPAFGFGPRWEAWRVPQSAHATRCEGRSERAR